MNKRCVREKMKKVMREFKAHKLHSGRSKRVVLKRKQAIAIGLSVSRKKCK